MKKEKIMLITACIAGLAIGGIIGLSELFEAGWNRQYETENNLETDENVLQREETSFDYPFTIAEGDVNPPEGSIEYQQVANMCGEILKYITGETAHRKEPAEITYLNYEDRGCYRYRFSYGERPDQYRFHIRPNGDIITICFERELSGHSEPSFTEGEIEPDENEKSKITETAHLYMDIIGVKSNAESYSVRSFNSRKPIVDIPLNDTSYWFATMYMIKTDGGEYEMEQVSFFPSGKGQ